MVGIINNEIEYIIMSFSFAILIQNFNLGGKKLVLKKFLFLIGILFVMTNIVSLLIKPLLIIVTLIFITITCIKLYNLRIVDALFTSVISYVILIIADIFSSIVTSGLFHSYVIVPSYDYFLRLIAYLSIAFFCMLSVYFKMYIAYIIRNLNKRKYFKNIKINYSSMVISYLILIALILVIYYTVDSMLLKTNADKRITLLSFGLFFLLFIVNVFFIFLYNSVFRQKNILEQTENENQQLRTYTGIIENLLKNLAKKEHDYKNILLSMNGYLETNDLQGLKVFFNDEVIQNSKGLSKNDQTNLSLNKIGNPGLKGLIFAKITNAIETGINVQLGVNRNVNDINMRTYDLCRIVGILLDNAAEASFESEHKQLEIAIIENDTDVSLTIGNTFRDKPEIGKIFIKGYSTKGADRGNGLNIVREIINEKYENVLLDTFIENGMFVQDMIIKK